MKKPKFQRPEPTEQEILDSLVVRPITMAERPRYDELMKTHHYLRSHHLVGEQICYVATHQGRWLALSSWCACARHLKARDQFIGWTAEQCRTRRALIANNARMLILPQEHRPNLASRMMRLVLERLSSDWQDRFKHPIVLVETFVDPEQFRGTTYQCSGWTQLGLTQGWGRHAKDYYVQHDQPKQLWVRLLDKKAAQRLRAPTLPESWAVVESKVAPRCRAKSSELKALTDHLAQIPEYRSGHALGFPLAGLLALIAVAVFSGVVRGKKDLAAFARTLSQSQRRALRFRREPKTGRYRTPGVTTFFRILNQVDEQALELALLAWQDQVLGPVQDQLIAIDGKKLRASQGGELVSAVGAQSGRWLGTVRTPDKTNEITAARTLLERLNDRLSLQGKVVVLDALHTNQETARLIVQELGADYLFTVKANSQGLHDTVQKLLKAGSFFPSRSRAERQPQGEQPGASGVAATDPAGHQPRTGVFCGSGPNRATQDPDAAPRQTSRQGVGSDYQRQSHPVDGLPTAEVSAPVLGD
jgi:hypothetical protein